MGKFKTEQI